MKQEYSISISANRSVDTKEDFISIQGENEVTVLTLDYPAELNDYNTFIEFSASGDKFRDVIFNKEYIITRAITKYSKVLCQIVFEKSIDDDTEVLKSEIFSLNFKSSINAEDDIDIEHKVDVFNTLVDTLNLKISDVEGLEQDVNNLITEIQTKLDNGDFKGDKGDKGDCNFATFEIENGYLIGNTTDDMSLQFELNNNGEMEVIING